MDIRNFFGKGKSGKSEKPKKTKKATSSNAASRPGSSSSLQPTRDDSDVQVSANETPVNTHKQAAESSGQDTRAQEGKKRTPEVVTVSPSKKRKEEGKGSFSKKKQESEIKSAKEQDISQAKTSSADKKRRRDMLEVDEQGVEETGVTLSPKAPPSPKPSSTVSKSPTPVKDLGKSSPEPKMASKLTARKTTPSSSAKKTKKEPLLQPTLTLTSYNTDSAVPECLSGRTFVFTGVLTNVSRDQAQDFVKILGGRVTGSVSSKTDYLVVGDILEDGRPYTDGSKYRKAMEHGVILVKGEESLYGLAKLYSDKIGKDRPEAKQAPAAVAKAPVANPYARRPANPYAKAAGAMSSNGTFNPYATKAADSTTKVSAEPAGRKGDSMSLWADKFAPNNTRDILGNQESVKKLQSWLDRWEAIFNAPKARGKTFSSPNGPWKAALLSGPPGIGKTTTATLVAKESGRDLLELNASDVRSKKALSEGLGDVTGSHVINFKQGASGKGKVKNRCIIMDEVDGMGAGDRSGMAELIKMIKASKVPIICICNDRQSQKIRSLVPYCMDLRFRRPTKSVIARRAVRIGQQEGLRIELNAAEAIAESCGNDIRQVLNCMQMWANKNGSDNSMTYKNVKERSDFINKDEILRVSMFDATRMIVEGRKGLTGEDRKADRSSLFKRSDAYFVDYSLMGLNIHQNYLKVMVGSFSEAKRSRDEKKIQNVLERMHEATHTMSDFAMAEHSVRSGDQNWGLLPLCAILAVKTGYHGGGESGGFLPGFPEFAAWMGKNSTRGKKSRLLQELGHHMNYRIGGDSSELRMCYLPVLRERFMSLLTSQDETKTTEAIALLDEYGLDRDDLFENFDEFKMDSKAKLLSSALDSKQKAAFTREYNKGSHKSQALIDEQGVVKTRKKAKSSSETDPGDLDAVNDDVIEESDDDDDDDLESEKIRQKFMKKAAKTAAAKKKKAKNGAKGKK